MLVLGRRMNEVIVLELPDGQRIEVSLVGLRPDMAKLGIVAPPAVRVMRAEILQRIAAGETPRR